MEGVQVHSEPAGLAVAFATLSAYVGPVSRVRPHVTRQLYGLGEDSLAVLAHIHLPWKIKEAHKCCLYMLHDRNTASVHAVGFWVLHSKQPGGARTPSDHTDAVRPKGLKGGQKSTKQHSQTGNCPVWLRCCVLLSTDSS